MNDTAPLARKSADEDGAAASHRRCIATGELRDRAELLRFVIGPDGELVPDLAARLPGRGLWLTPRRDIVERAVAKRLFARAARQPVATAPGLADRIEALLAQRCCDALGLARRAGVAVAGFERVSDSVRHGKAKLLVFALDGAEAGRRRFGGLGRDLSSATALTGAELGAAFGRERVAHVSIGPGPLCQRLLVDLERIAGFRAEARVERGARAERGMNSAPVGPGRQDGGTEPNE